MNNYVFFVFWCNTLYYTVLLIHANHNLSLYGITHVTVSLIITVLLLNANHELQYV